MYSHIFIYIHIYIFTQKTDIQIPCDSNNLEANYFNIFNLKAFLEPLLNKIIYFKMYSINYA